MNTIQRLRHPHTGWNIDHSSHKHHHHTHLQLYKNKEIKENGLTQILQLKKNRWNEFLHWNACKEVSREGTTRMRRRWWRRIRNISEHSNIVVGQVDAVDVGLGEHGLGYHHVGDCSWLWRIHSCQWGKITIPIITLKIKSIVILYYLSVGWTFSDIPAQREFFLHLDIHSIFTFFMLPLLDMSIVSRNWRRNSNNPLTFY